MRRVVDALHPSCHYRRMIRRPRSRLGGALLVLALVVVALPGPAVPAAQTVSVQAKVLAPSFVAIDAASGHVLAARGANIRRPIASLTKVMTALTVIERGNLEGRIVVSPLATQVEPYKEGLVAGRSYTRDTLLWSALLASSNDSATALAIDAGGSLPGFYALANAKARALGMTSTTYASASGLDDVRNLSTAMDQAVLARAALQNPTFARIVATRTHWTKWAAPTRAKLWVNHNKMLATTPGTYGVKTGWTSRAGGCLIVALRRGNESVIGVLLGSPSIWSDMNALMNVAFNRLG
jgi:D-alanyl-D-alanine carboxypeptidase (penicillin-binding protein 5/6)